MQLRAVTAIATCLLDQQHAEPQQRPATECVYGFGVTLGYLPSEVEASCMDTSIDIIHRNSTCMDMLRHTLRQADGEVHCAEFPFLQHAL